ncbi:MAG: hypothetical protein PVG79_04390 [Gemmatimonadales bacterium]
MKCAIDSAQPFASVHGQFYTTGAGPGELRRAPPDPHLGGHVP